MTVAWRSRHEIGFGSTVRAERNEWAVHFAAHPLSFPLMLALRRWRPVTHVPGIGHIVNDPAIARAVLLEAGSFSKNGPGSAGELISQVMGDYALLNLEGEEHHDLRQLLAPALSASAIHRLTDEVWATRLDEAVEALRAGKTVDLAHLSAVLTGRTMGHLLGVTHLADDTSSLATFELGERMVRVVKLRNRPLSARQVARARAMFLSLTDGLAAAMPNAPDGSIIARLTEGGFGEARIRGVGAALLLTGMGTVSTALPRMIALITDTGAWDRLHDRPSRLEAIDECLRYITPSPAMLRSVERDVTIGGHRFQKGRRVVIMTYAAVRDFPSGDSFGPGREQPASSHGLHFGAGIHRCIGYALAHAELELSLQRLSSVAPLRVSRRVAARRVLIPRYRVLEVRRSR